ncbi:hypothetical protein LWI29_025286 [Acer saccharum]|uniref:Uncharacterized protein n=1 Tax=Acer saccharum TaxID=4024 RepID=A0AA39S054_ACESA|nr:hypothetical protein LWI29_025286 [Acer saccharum]
MADKEVTDPLTASIESITENATVETGLEEDAAATETGSPIHDEMDSFHSQLVEGVSVLEKIIAELKAKRCGSPLYSWNPGGAPEWLGSVILAVFIAVVISLTLVYFLSYVHLSGQLECKIC